jgi:hypothetical protein
MRPLLVFEENFRPASLLVQVYRLLECPDGPVAAGDTLERLRAALGHAHDEDLLLVINDLFAGVVRASARVHPSDLRLRSLANLLRQAVVAACSAMDAYLPLLLRTHLPTVIRARQREFMPTDDQTKAFLGDFRLNAAQAIRLVTEPDQPAFLGSLILNHVRNKAFGNSSGLHIAGALLGLDSPWDRIGERLNQRKGELQSRVNAIVSRRNDIVHRADRPASEPDADPQEIHLSWTTMHVETLHAVVLALDELVEHQMREYEALLASDIRASDSATLVAGEV